jgi:hypothetical protein
MESIFTNIYETCLWGTNHNTEYNGSSGRGSDIDYNINTYIPFLQKFITDHTIQNVVDLGCGDFRCGSSIYDNLDIVYTGYDVYRKIIDYNTKTYLPPKYTFQLLDFYNNPDQIQPAELYIIKDVLQHWKMEEIYTFLDSLVEQKKCNYILIVNCCNQRWDNPENNGRSTPLSASLFPLKKYNPKKLYHYHTKEVSVIELL